MKKYSIKNGPGFRFNEKKAQKYCMSLKNLKRKNGLLNPEIVIEDAQNKNSPYHDEFIWDDTLAAHKWRIHTARNFINSFYIEIENFHEPVRMFESVIINRIKQYEEIEVISKKHHLMSQIISEIKIDISRLQNKYKRYEQLESFWKQINVLINEQ